MDSFKRRLLTEPKGNQKLEKTQKLTGVAVYSLSLAPASSSGVANLCKWASEACIAHCVGAEHNGLSQPFASIFRARIAKTEWLVNQPTEFRSRLVRELELASRRHARLGEKVAFRLNCFSDLPWIQDPLVRPTLETLYHQYGAVSYDYTAAPSRYRGWLAERPAWYHMTLSRKEHTPIKLVRDIVNLGGNVAVVFRSPAPRGAVWQGMPVIDGDASDLRYTDRPGTIVALKAKGSARQSDGGFVVDHPWGTSPALRDRSGTVRAIQARREREAYDRRCAARSVWESRSEMLPSTMALLRSM